MSSDLRKAIDEWDALAKGGGHKYDSRKRKMVGGKLVWVYDYATDGSQKARKETSAQVAEKLAARRGKARKETPAQVAAAEADLRGLKTEMLASHLQLMQSFAERGGGPRVEASVGRIARELATRKDYGQPLPHWARKHLSGPKTHVIGHTLSGKPIRTSKAKEFHDDTVGWSRLDHLDAMSQHSAKATKIPPIDLSQPGGRERWHSDEHLARRYHEHSAAAHKRAAEAPEKRRTPLDLGIGSSDVSHHKLTLAARRHHKKKTTKSEDNDVDLVKSVKPPAGFHPIPGGKSGGFTNGKPGQKRRYWYPHGADHDAAAAHHATQARAIEGQHRGRMTPSGYPKDKAAKKELEDHWHAHYALKDGDFRSGPAPKKARGGKSTSPSGAVDEAAGLGKLFAAAETQDARVAIGKKRDALIASASGMDAQMDISNAFHQGKQRAIFARNKVESDKVLTNTNKSEDNDMDLVKGGGPYIGKRGGKWADPQHKVPYNDKKHAGKTVSAKDHDAHGADNLQLMADNSGPLHGTRAYMSASQERRSAHALHQQKQSIQANLTKKIAAGKYDHAQATKLWGHLASAANDHNKAHYGGGHADPATRMAAGKQMADQFHDEVQGGDHDDHEALTGVHKKRADKGGGLSKIAAGHKRPAHSTLAGMASSAAKGARLRGDEASAKKYETTFAKKSEIDPLDLVKGTTRPQPAPADTLQPQSVNTALNLLKSQFPGTGTQVQVGAITYVQAPHVEPHGRTVPPRLRPAAKRPDVAMGAPDPLAMVRSPHGHLVRPDNGFNFKPEGE
jgi:hypothetical protein